MQNAGPDAALDWSSDDIRRLRIHYDSECRVFRNDAPKDVEFKKFSVLGLSGIHFTPPEVTSAVPILYFHGGGWCVGSPETHFALCATLAAVTCREVLSVRYRLTPEHAFPAQAVDAVTALNAFLQGRLVPFDPPLRVALAGDSAGAAMALWAEAGLSADQLPMIEQIVGFYGAFGLRDSGSIRRNDPEQSGISKRDMQAFYDRLGPALPVDMRQSFRANGAPVTLLACENDPYRDDSAMLANWFTSEGRDARLLMVPGGLHGFLKQAGRSRDAALWMKRAFAGRPSFYARARPAAALGQQGETL